MRSALETPSDQAIREPIEAFIPAAAAWISILGREMYDWDKEFPYGSPYGDPGGGGPLWDGQHGFCKGRWQLWRERFKELSKSDELSNEARETAARAAATMAEIDGA